MSQNGKSEKFPCHYLDMKTLLVVLVLLITVNGQAPVEERVPFMVRALINDGVFSPFDRQCSDSDKTKIKEAISVDAINSYSRIANTWYADSIYTNIMSSISTMFQQLGWGFGKRRRLTTHRELQTLNCPKLCCNYKYGSCYQDYKRCAGFPKSYSGCPGNKDPFGRRLNNVVFGEEFVMFDANHNVLDRTQTIANADQIDLDACHTRITDMIQTMAAERKAVSRDCATFLNSPVTFQCLWKDLI